MNSKLAKLQSLCSSKNLDGYIISNSDQFLSEYTKDADNDLKNYTNFSGSAGIGVFYENTIHLFTDGRYELQAEKQLPPDSKIYISPKNKFSDWLQDQIKKGKKFGLDYKKFRSFSFRELDQNNLINIELTKAASAKQNIFIHDIKFAGKSAESKILEVRQELANQACEDLVVEDLDSISWLLNLRSDFYEFNPAIAAKFILSSGVSKLFIDDIKLEIMDYLKDLNIEVFKVEEFSEFFARLNHEKTLIEHTSSLQVKSSLPNAKAALSPIMALKAKKNKVEISGSKSCHIEDAKAIHAFHKWFNSEFSAGNYYTEFQLSKKLTDFRKQRSNYFSDSFPSIVGFEGNGAVIHYRPQQNDSKTVKGRGLLLIDSGGQYKTGTTDVTRVFCLGKPQEEEITRYTQVLMGHIDAASYVFEYGETGKTIDELARKYLRKEGLDYAHGTGHGVGSFLNVHEGPYSVSSMSQLPLKEGVVVSIEPGYYKKGEYGIRIENLYLVSKRNDNQLFFEPLTLYPFEEKLIDYSMLNKSQKEWLKHYSNLVSKHLFDGK
ncbi:MAG: M24 family metallopeptidase [Rickettsiales bacterium]